MVQKRCVSLARVQPKGPLEGQLSSQSWGLLVLKTPDVVFVHWFMYDENLATGLGHRVLVRVCNLLAKVAWVVHPSICRRNESYDSRFIPPFSGCQWHSGTLRSLGLIWDHLLTHFARFLGSIRRCVVRYNLPGWSRDDGQCDLAHHMNPRAKSVIYVFWGVTKGVGNWQFACRQKE